MGRSVLQLHRTELGKDPNDLGNGFFPELSDQADPLILPLKTWSREPHRPTRTSGLRANEFVLLKLLNSWQFVTVE